MSTTAVEQSPEFQKAVEDSRKLKSKPNNDELLQVKLDHSLSLIVVFTVGEIPISCISMVAWHPPPLPRGSNLTFFQNFGETTMSVTNESMI